MSDDAWQWPYFRRRTVSNLTPAPTRPRSDAMGECISRRPAPEPQAQGRDWGRQRERENEQKLRALVERFGIDAVEAILRRADPTFTLPVELRTPKRTTSTRKAHKGR
jgi:hypothetical protein